MDRIRLAITVFARLLAAVIVATAAMALLLAPLVATIGGLLWWLGWIELGQL